MKAKHIAGPWIAQANPDSIDIEGYKRIVAVVPGTDDEAIDISRLIAAAPTLLAALEELVQASYDSVNGKQYAPYHVEELGRATVAIAKAKGGE